MSFALDAAQTDYQPLHPHPGHRSVAVCHPAGARVDCCCPQCSVVTAEGDSEGVERGQR